MKKGMYCFISVCVMLLISATFVEAITITSLPYTITKQGYYTINNNLYSSGHGIIVNANNVTIDLNGYTIEGKGTGIYHGIYMPGYNNVEIRNGTIKYFGGEGISGGFAHSNRVINVRAMKNKLGGIYLSGSNNMVKDCTVSDNGSSVDIEIYGFDGYGISTDYGSTVIGNTAYNNGRGGIKVRTGSAVIGNTVSYNGGDGIVAGEYGTAPGGAPINIPAEGCTIKNNTISFNRNYGIHLGTFNLVDGNTAYNNNQSGGSFTNISTCGSCTFGVNVAP